MQVYFVDIFFPTPMADIWQVPRYAGVSGEESVYPLLVSYDRPTDMVRHGQNPWYGLSSMSYFFVLLISKAYTELF